MEGPAGVLRCPAPGTLVQRLTDHIQSGASPLGNNVQNPAQRLAPLLHPGGSLQPSLPAPNPGVVSSNIKVCESSNLELTHPMVVASSADTLRMCVKHIAEGGTNERDLRNERRWAFDPGECPGAGRVPQHGTPVPLPAQGKGWRIAGCWIERSGPWGTRAATRRWRSMCARGGSTNSLRRRCGLRRRPASCPRSTGAACRRTDRNRCRSSPAWVERRCPSLRL